MDCLQRRAGISNFLGILHEQIFMPPSGVGNSPIPTTTSAWVCVGKRPCLFQSPATSGTLNRRSWIQLALAFPLRCHGSFLHSWQSIPIKLPSRYMAKFPRKCQGNIFQTMTSLALNSPAKTAREFLEFLIYTRPGRWLLGMGFHGCNLLCRILGPNLTPNVALNGVLRLSFVAAPLANV